MQGYWGCGDQIWWDLPYLVTPNGAHRNKLNEGSFDFFKIEVFWSSLNRNKMAMQKQALPLKDK